MSEASAPAGRSLPVAPSERPLASCDEVCEICGSADTFWRACKVVCRSCGGISRSCADL